jgi:hypothetical protein
VSVGALGINGVGEMAFGADGVLKGMAACYPIVGVNKYFFHLVFSSATIQGNVCDLANISLDCF